MDKKKRLYCLVVGILCFVGAAVVYNIATETGIMDNSIKICIGCVIVGGLVMLAAGLKKTDKTDKTDK